MIKARERAYEEPGGPPPGWRTDSGHRSLDFVNTLDQRWNGGREQLQTPEDVLGWLREVGFEFEAAHGDPGLLAVAIELRENIDALVASLVDGSLIPAGPLEHLNLWLRRSNGMSLRLSLDEANKPVLVRHTLDTETPATALERIACEAAELLGSPQRDRLRICNETHCSMRFLDRSNGGRRRWCSSRCSTRHHMRERRRGQSAPGGPTP